MKSNILVKLVLMVGLLALFGLAYGFAKTVSQSSPNPSESPEDIAGEFVDGATAVGQVGGSHYLRDIRFEDHPTFERLVIITQLNRSSILEGSIGTPYIEASPGSGQAPTLELAMADTTQIYEEEGEPENIYTGPRDTASWPTQLFSSFSIPDPTEGGQRLILGLDQARQYRLAVDPENTGNVWLDVLK